MSVAAMHKYLEHRDKPRQRQPEQRTTCAMMLSSFLMVLQRNFLSKLQGFFRMVRVTLTRSVNNKMKRIDQEKRRKSQQHSREWKMKRTRTRAS